MPSDGTSGNNTAGRDGGGIWTGNGGTLTLNKSNVTGNTANDGGGIWANNGGTLNKSTVTGNMATTDPGIDDNGSPMTLNKSNVQPN